MPLHEKDLAHPTKTTRPPFYFATISKNSILGSSFFGHLNLESKPPYMAQTQNYLKVDINTLVGYSITFCMLSKERVQGCVFSRNEAGSSAKAASAIARVG